MSEPIPPVLKVQPSGWTTRWAQLSAGDGIGSVMLALLGSFGSGRGLWGYETGFMLVGVGLLLAAIAVLASLIAFAKARGTTLPKGGIWFGLMCAIGLLAVAGYWAKRASDYPAIHDVTTNLAAPPAFSKLVLRSDNLVGPGSEQRWRELHAAAYSNIGSLFIKAPQATVMQRVKTIVNARGWDVVLSTNERVEATVTATPFQFKYDVVITVAATEGGKVSQVDMRSVSRVGISDFGVNADRIRSFLADLSHSHPNAQSGQQHPGTTAKP